jgi:hypothetical protein
MPTQYLKFTGTCKWAKIRKPDDKYGFYSVDMYLDDASWEVFKASGLMLEPKETEDGWYVRFRRPHQKIIKQELVTFGPPEVTGTTELVGNGSKVTCDVVVYETQKGKGHRLNKITVLELVPFNPEPKAAVPTAPVQEEKAPVEVFDAPEPKAAKRKRPF